MSAETPTTIDIKIPSEYLACQTSSSIEDFISKHPENALSLAKQALQAWCEAVVAEQTYSSNTNHLILYFDPQALEGIKSNTDIMGQIGAENLSAILTGGSMTVAGVKFKTREKVRFISDNESSVPPKAITKIENFPDEDQDLLDKLLKTCTQREAGLFPVEEPKRLSQKKASKLKNYEIFTETPKQSSSPKVIMAWWRGLPVPIKNRSDNSDDWNNFLSSNGSKMAKYLTEEDILINKQVFLSGIEHLSTPKGWAIKKAIEKGYLKEKNEIFSLSKFNQPGQFMGQTLSALTENKLLTDSAEILELLPRFNQPGQSMGLAITAFIENKLLTDSAEILELLPKFNQPGQSMGLAVTALIENKLLTNSAEILKLLPKFNQPGQSMGLAVTALIKNKLLTNSAEILELLSKFNQPGQLIDQASAIAIQKGYLTEKNGISKLVEEFQFAGETMSSTLTAAQQTGILMLPPTDYLFQFIS